MRAELVARLPAIVVDWQLVDLAAAGNVSVMLDDSASVADPRFHAALERIERGTFGLCIACERPIERRRIDTDPLADRCIACAGGLCNGPDSVAGAAVS